MAYALWIRDGLAIAEGTHEYRPLGVAVIAESAVFRARDFSGRRRAPQRYTEGFAGLFASIEDVNRYLIARRARKPRAPSPRVLSTF